MITLQLTPEDYHRLMNAVFTAGAEARERWIRLTDTADRLAADPRTQPEELELFRAMAEDAYKVHRHLTRQYQQMFNIALLNGYAFYPTF